MCICIHTYMEACEYIPMYTHRYEFIWNIINAYENNNSPLSKTWNHVGFTP